MVKITLEVSTKQALEIFKLLNKESTIDVANKPKQKVKSPEKGITTPIPKPSPKTGTKMPTFGRTSKQIEQFDAIEQERFERQTEEELLKAQRKADREAKKAAKEAEVDKALKDALALKKAENNQAEKVQEVLVKPTWKL